MTHSYSMEGFELRVEGPVLEMRSDGERTETRSREAGRAFDSFISDGTVQGVIFDLRGADYAYSDQQWEERAHAFARQCRDLPLAVIDREDQAGRTRRLLELHSGMAGRNAGFRSRKQAQDWIQQCIDCAAER